jgi:hypothetical protein
VHDDVPREHSGVQPVHSDVPREHSCVQPVHGDVPREHSCVQPVHGYVPHVHRCVSTQLVKQEARSGLLPHVERMKRLPKYGTRRRGKPAEEPPQPSNQPDAGSEVQE